MSTKQTYMPRPPAGLGDPGRTLWRSILSQIAEDGLTLDAKELHFLALSCAEADLVAVLAKGLEGQPLLVRGSQGQQVAHPLIAEVRQHRMAGASLLARIKLEESAAAAGTGSATTPTRARAAAFARRYGNVSGL